MRRLLIEGARRKQARKRGGDVARRDFDPATIVAPEVPGDLLDLDESLRRLEAHAPAQAALVKLRYFAGLTIPQAAEALGIAPRTADAYWSYARGRAPGPGDDGNQGPGRRFVVDLQPGRATAGGDDWRQFECIAQQRASDLGLRHRGGGRELLTLPAIGKGSLTFSPDGLRLSYVSATKHRGDAEVQVWDATPLPDDRAPIAQRLP